MPAGPAVGPPGGVFLRGEYGTSGGLGVADDRLDRFAGTDCTARGQGGQGERDVGQSRAEAK